jgi:hypothetical protein
MLMIQINKEMKGSDKFCIFDPNAKDKHRKWFFTAFHSVVYGLFVPASQLAFSVEKTKAGTNN